MAIKALVSTIQSHDVAQLQQMLGSSNDIEVLKKYFVDQNGQYKWAWLNHLPNASMLDKLTKLTPLASAGISAVYSRRLVDEVNQKAQQVFSNARQYLIQHTDTQLSPLGAYEKSLELLAQATPKLLESIKSIEHSLKEPLLDQQITLSDNKNISQVKVVKKTKARPATKEEKGAQVSNELNALAKKELAPSEAVPPQQPALAETEEEVWEAEFDTDHVAEIEEPSVIEDVQNPIKKSVTRKSVTKVPK